LVFKRQTPPAVLEVARRVGTTDVQLHETPEEDALLLEGEGMTVYRVRRIDADTGKLPSLTPEPTAERPILLDVGGGGSGRAFRWELLGSRAPHAVFIAGGIRPDNIAALLARRPYGIDLSSGVESRPGLKDPARMTAFFEALEKSP
jgi:phosphoribosylanthranilate isomerase